MSLGSTSALPACQPSSCTPCIFGAATSLYTYPFYLETVTVRVIPVVTPLPDGSWTTSYSTSTATENITNAQPPISQFTDAGAVTWEILDGVTGTSPTTYVQYTDFYGAPGVAATSAISSEPAPTCAQWSAVTRLPTPSSISASPLVVPLASDASPGSSYWPQNTVPPQVLDYLEGLNWVESFMHDENLATCAASFIPQPAPSICTTESISTITTCSPTTRLNATTCVDRTIETTVVITSGVPNYSSPLGTPPSNPTTTSGGDRTFPSPPTYYSTSPVNPETLSPGSATVASSPNAHTTAHLLTTITVNPITVSFDGSHTDGPGSPPPQVSGQGASGPQNQDPGPSQGLGSGNQPTLLSDQLEPQSSPPTSQTAIVLGSQTVLPGGVITQDGTTVSYASAGSIVYVNGQSTPVSGTAVTIGTDVVAVVPTLVGTATISPGQVVTVAGTTLSLPNTPGGTVYLNGQPTSMPGSVVTIAGTIFTLASQAPSTSGNIAGLVGQSSTILPGEVITTDGATVSLATSAGTVYVNGQPTVISGPVITVGTDVFTVITTTEVVTTTPDSGNGGAIFRATGTPVPSKKSSANGRLAAEVTVWLSMVTVMGLTTFVILL